MQSNLGMVGGIDLVLYGQEERHHKFHISHYMDSNCTTALLLAGSTCCGDVIYFKFTKYLLCLQAQHQELAQVAIGSCVLIGCIGAVD